MDVQLRVLPQDTLILLWTYQVLWQVPLRSAHFSDVGRPELGRGGAPPPKPLFELVRVEHPDEGLRGRVTRQHKFLLGFLVDEDLEAFVDETLAPAYRSVIAYEKVVHEVFLC